MYSKQEANQLKTEFWIAFGKSFPRKWILYDTKIKDFSFQFYADNKKAEVAIVLSNHYLVDRSRIWKFRKKIEEYLEY